MLPVGVRLPVGHGLGQVRALPLGAGELLDRELVYGESRPESLRTALERSHTDAFVALHRGEVVEQWYAERSLETAPQALMSITKSMIGCAAGVLVEQGLLDVAAPAVAYVPDLANGGYADVTVRDLLDQRTGGDYREDHDDPDGEVALIGNALLGVDESRPTLRGLVAYSPRLGISGGPFAYRTLDTEALAWVLEVAAGRPLVSLLADLLTPLGLESECSISVDRLGVPHFGGGLAMTARDLARFGLMLLNGGAVGMTQVVPVRFLQDVRAGADDSVAAFRESLSRREIDAPANVATIYRNQFWVPAQRGRRLLCLGIHGQLLLVDPDNEAVIVKLSSWPDARDPDLFSLGLTCAATVAETLGGHRPDRPHLIA